MTTKETLNLIDYVQAKGVLLTIFAEEEGYAQNFTDDQGNRGSYPKGQTARFHFVGMIIKNNFVHGYETPLTNLQIKEAHPELTDQKIDAMRGLFNQNKNIRPFEFPVQVKNSNDELTNLLFNDRQSVYSYLLQNKPLVNYQTATYERPGLARKFSIKEKDSSSTIITPNAPSSATSGDIWINTSTGLNYVFVIEDGRGYWVEM